LYKFAIRKKAREMSRESKNTYLSNRIKEGEHKQQDFKYEINDSKKIARSLSAFANTEGGRLLIGVKDNGKIKGVSSDEEYHMVEAASQMHTRPQVPFITEKHEHKGLTVLEIIVKTDANGPYLAPDPRGKMRAYIRVDDQNRIADPIQFMVWKNRKKQRSIQIRYTEPERFLLNYLSEHDHISRKQFIKYAGISRAKAVRILTNMAGLGLIKILHTEGETLFAAGEEI